MVEPKSKKAFYFTAFILPCLVLYITFFIAPFIRGIGISLTNWDGLTPKTPIILPKDEFESKILTKLKKQSDKDYVLKIYSLDPSDNSYKRISIGGVKRWKLEKIIKKTGYEPDLNKFVGFENYKKVFTGKVKEDFYPRTYMQPKYNRESELPASITKTEFEKEVLKGCKNKEQKAFLKSCYIYDAENQLYRLDSRYDEYLLTQPLWNLPEVNNGSVDQGDLDNLIRNIKSVSSSDDRKLAMKFIADFTQQNRISSESRELINDSVEPLFKTGEVKNALADAWIVRKVNMGVIGFTLFFAFFSVIGINVLAFALALALDSGIKGQKILRSAFFMPNVLSMVIVALIWSMLFTQLLPAVTGIDKWISDPKKTPWLLVVVSVWQGCGYYMIVYLAGLQNIPVEIIEAAKIDGTSSAQQFRYITLPMMLPAITISLFLSIANALKSFDLIFAMIGQTGYATGTVPFVMDIYFDAFGQKQAGMATAKAMVLFLVIFLVTGIQLYTMKKKEIDA